MSISLKKIFNFLKSMKFGLLLLGLLCFVAIIGSIIPQGREEAFYLNTYTSLWSQIIVSFKLYDIYHSLGFILIFFALTLNLFLCSTIRLRKLLKQNRLSLLGSWLIHVGLLAIIISYSYGQYTYFDTYAYGTPGSTLAVAETNFFMKINDFNVVYREDGSVQQYITDATLSDKEGNALVSGEISVNHPMRYEGYTFYQHSTGWASDIDVYKDSEHITKTVLYDGTAYVDNEEYLILQMHHFYPDFIATEAGFASKSNHLNNPKILYSLFYGGQRVLMNVTSLDEDIHWQNYTFKFSQPQRYTYLSVNKMNGKAGAMIGSGIIILGLFLAFYGKSKEIISTKNKEVSI